MNQKFMIVDDFYDIAHQYHQSFYNKECLITEETTQKLSYILDRSANIIKSFNEVMSESDSNPVTANLASDWIAVIYLTLPPNCVSKKGLSFYTHKKTGLDSFPNKYACQINGWQSMEDIEKSFDANDKSEWEEYSNIFVKYNRCVIFRSDYWHSYGYGFGQEINNSMLYQKLLLKNA